MSQKVRVGDVVEVTYHLKVDAIVSNWTKDKAPTIRADYQDFFLGYAGVQSWHVVKPRNYKVGDVITGAELQDGKWKRGTVVTEGGHAFLLLASGVWQTTDDLGDTEIFFSDFDRSDDDLKFTIVHLPTAER